MYIMLNHKNNTKHTTPIFYLALACLFSLLSACNKVDLGISGPTVSTVLKPGIETSIEDYAHGGNSRLAILVTDPDSAWLGLAHGLKSIGVPFQVTRDWHEALKHRVVLVYPRVSGRLIEAEALRQLAQLPHNGGVLIAFDVLGGGLNQTFGIKGSIPSDMRFSMRFSGQEIQRHGFDDINEQELKLGNRAKSPKALGTLAYELADGEVLAQYEDESAAMVSKSFPSGGVAIAIGMDFGDYILRGHNNRADLLYRSYVNGFEPASDVLLRWLRDQYMNHEPLAISLGTVPQGRDLSVVISHDIDYQRSISNAIAYAEYEKSQNISATYFVQTKYMRDWSDIAFFNEDGIALTAKIASLGGEIASHSVSHSHTFKDFPLGSGEEQYPGYSPFVRSFDNTTGGTLLGELRVSKFLLEHATRRGIESFRPGHLSNPPALPQLLEATGYSYSSSVTANDSLTHLPFRLNRMHGPKEETAIYEFPVTVEDEAEPPLGQRLQPALKLAKQIAEYGGLYVVLIHPDVLDHKFVFEKELVAALRSRAWFGSLREFGAWWRARDQVEVDVEKTRAIALVHLRAPAMLRGLTLDIPQGWKLREGDGAAHQLKAGRVMVDKLEGEMVLSFEISSAPRLRQ